MVSDVGLIIGATFESHVSEGETPTFNGSAVIFVAESAEAVRSLLAEDVYTKSGVWDLDNARIIPVCISLFFLVIVSAWAGWDVWC